MKVIKIKEAVCDAIQYDGHNIRDILNAASEHQYVRRLASDRYADSTSISFFRETGSGQLEIESFDCETIYISIDILNEDGFWTTLEINKKNWIIFTETEVQICSDKDFKKTWKSLEPIKENDGND